MPVIIRPLTPALAEDYARFFDTTPHSTGIAEHRCYCVCWCSDPMGARDFSTAEKRREAALLYVREGYLQGYLAYEGERIVGWCNANERSRCLECCSWTMFMGDIRRDEPAGARVKSVFCFAIAPEARGQGVASQLLARVAADAKRDGFACVEAYPNRAFVSTEDDFMGPRALFERAGFEAAYEAGERLVMRKRL